MCLLGSRFGIAHFFAALACLACISGARADQPKVAKAALDVVDRGVDPALKEIRIEFDLDMSPRGQSICGGGPAFPRITGKSSWERKRVCIIPVELEPDHDYALSINCPAAQNFRGENGEAAEAYPIRFRTGSSKREAADGVKSPGESGKTLTPEINRKSLRELRRAIDEQYSYRDIHKADWDKLFADNASKLESAESGTVFARQVARVLAAAKDLHISVSDGQTTFPTHRRNAKPNCETSVLPRIVPNWKDCNDCVATGRFPDGTGYILIKSWSHECAEGLKAAVEALGELTGSAADRKPAGLAKSVIVDVRVNGGGDELLAREFAGCFVREPKVYSRNDYRAAKEPTGFTKPFDRVVEPNKARAAFSGKVAVLMGTANVSSCESFLLMMKQVPGCKLIGEPSGGSSGNPKPQVLSNGVTVFLPSWRDMLPDGTILENRGVAPDIAVGFNSKPDSDPLIEAALKSLRAP